MKQKEIRVLLIEDDEEDYILVRSYLKEISSQGYKLDWVSSLRDGVKKIAEARHDVYLVDYNLGPDSGLELIEKACKDGCNRPLILLTGLNDRDIDMEAMKRGAADFLVKGHFDERLLERSIRYAIERKRSEHEREELVGAQIAAREAEKSEMRISNILESITNAFLAVDTNWRFTYLNKQITKMLGKSSEELIGKNIWEAFPKAKDTIFYKKYNEAVRTQKPVEFEAYSPYMKGWFLVQAYPTKDGLSAYYTDISERKKTRHDLDRFKFMADHANVSLMLLDKTGSILYANRMSYQSLGYTKKEFMELNIADINSDLNRKMFGELFERLQTEELPAVETSRQKKSGILLPVEATYTRVTFEGVPYIFAVATDITKRKRAQAALNDRIQQQAVVTVLGIQALSGISLPELMKEAVSLLANVLQVEYTKILELLPGEQELVLQAGVGWKKHIKAGVSTVSAGKNSQAGYTLMSRKPVVVKNLLTEKRFNGPPLLHDHNVISGMSVIIHRKDKPYGVLGIHTTTERPFTQEDVAFLQAVSNVLSMAIDHKESEVHLRESEERFRTLADTAPVLIWMSDTKNNGTYFNKVWLEFTGRKVEDELGTGWVESIHPDDLKRATETCTFAFNDRKPFKMEFRMKRADGKYRWILDNGIPRFTSDGKFLGYIGSCLDITDRKEVEKRKDEFIGLASHELKTPITTIKAFTQLLQRELPPDTKKITNSYLTKMDNHIDKLTNLVSDLLDISKIESGKIVFSREKFNIDDLLEEVSRDMQHTTEKHKIMLKQRARKTIVGDRERLSQVLVNLISNAIKYSPSADKVIIRSAVDTNNVIISVQDFGIGIPQNKRQLVFDRFSRVIDQNQHPFPGLGLGLYISKEIVSRHGGKIWAESEEGQGSTFYISLPISGSKRFFDKGVVN